MTAGASRPGRVSARRSGRLAAALLVAAAWSAPGVAAAAPAGARVLCTIRDERIAESSGLAAAGDSLYTVNDGGTRLRVFVLDRSCRVRDTITSPLDPYDVEDLARGPDGTLWLADTGDNAGTRATVAVERLRPDGSATLLRLRYPDGPRDAEALLLGADGRLFIVTKEPLTAAVYTPVRTPAAGRTTALRRVAVLSFAPTGTAGGPVGVASQVVVTGGAVAPDGRLVVLRTYTDAYVWSAPDGDVAAALGSGPGRRITLPETAQGEAVTVAADGRSLLTSTEGVPGPVHEIPLGDAAAAPSAGGDEPDPGAAAGPAGDDGGSALPLLVGGAALAVVLLLAGRAVRR